MRRLALGLAVLLVPAVAADAQARRGQTARRCDVVLDNTPDTRAQVVRDPSTGRSNAFFGGGIVVRCEGQDVRLTADSAEVYETVKLYYLIGNVKYREARASIDANRMTYFVGEERIVAEENVVATMENGSTLAGPRAEYFRAVAPLRTVPRMVALGRPTIRLAEEGKPGQQPPDPTVLVANTVTAEGDSLYYASGSVQITRTDATALGDSAALDNLTGYGRLMRGPEVRGRGERPFTLKGVAIDMYSQERQLRRVVAQDSARAVSEDLTLTSDTIDLRMTESRLNRAFAWGGSAGARAVSPDREIVADSIDVDMPDQRVREMRAIGTAYAETVPDTARLRSTERDWLRGDSIFARFDSAATADTSSRPKIRSLLARGSAASFYQIPSQSGPTAPPSINYVRGRDIVVAFDSGRVHTVTVEEKAVGVMLEPGADSASTGRRNSRPATPRGARPATTPRGGRPGSIPGVRRP